MGGSRSRARLAWLVSLARLLPRKSSRMLAIVIGILLLSESVTATPARFSPLFNRSDRRSFSEDFSEDEEGWGGSLSLAQQPATSSPNATTTDKQQAYTQARQLLKQARQLSEQGTAEQRQQALAKYEEALKIWQQLAVDEAPPYVARSFEAATLNSIGTIYYIQDEPQKALNSFEEGLGVSRDRKNRLQEAIARLWADTASSNSDDKQKLLNSYKQALTRTNRGEAALLGSLGNAYSRLGDNRKALDYYNQALSLYRSQKQPSDEASTLSSIGRLYLKLGETQSSLDSYNRALEIQRAEKDTAAQAETLQEIGRIYTGLGESQKAIAAYNQALEIQRETKDLAGQADILSQIGLLYSSLGEEQRALDAYNQALKLQQAAQGNLSGTALTFNLTRQAQILSAIGLAYTSLGFGDSAKSLDFYNQALTLYQKAGDKDGEASILNQISYLYNQLGDKQKALDVLNQSLVLQRAIPDPDGEADTLSDIADIYNSMAQPQQALDLYNQALDIQRRVNDRPKQAVTLNHMAQVYSSLGDYQFSIDTHNQALEIFRAIGDHSHQIETLNNIGLVYQAAKDYQKSLDSHNQALTLARQNNDFLRQFPILAAIARDYESLKDYPNALDAANQLLSLSRQHNSSYWEAISLAMSGRAYLASGDYPKALEATQKAVAELQKVGTRLGEANALRNLGKIYTSLKQYEQALSTYNSDLELRRMSGDRTGEAETLYNAAITQRDRGNLNQARTQIKAAINIVEDIRTRVTSQELRTSYFATVQNYYQFYIDVLMQLHKQNPSQGYDALALHASERARARSLLELLTEASADIRQGIEPKLLQQERTLQQKFDALEKRRLEISNDKDTEAQVQALEKETASLLEEYRQIQAQIRRTSPRYAALTQPQPLTLAEIQQQVLDDDTMLLEYSLGEERSYLWAVTKTGITSYELPKRADIEAAAKQFYRLLNNPTYRLGTRGGLGAEARPGSSIGNDEAATKLSQMLLAPVAAQLGNKRLLVVSDGALQYLPFAALPTPSTRLIQALAPPAPQLWGEQEFQSPPELGDLGGKKDLYIYRSLIQAETSSHSRAGEGLGERLTEKYGDLVPLLVNHEIVNLPSASTLGVLRKETSDRKSAPKAIARSAPAKLIAVLADPVFSKNDPRLTSNTGQVSGTQPENSNINRRALELSATTANVSFNRL